MKNKVFILWHMKNIEDKEEYKLLGVYSSNFLAKEKICKYKKNIGFKDYPDNFEIVEYEIDKDHWQEGFITVDNSENDG